MTFGVASLEKENRQYTPRNYFNFSKDKRSFVLRILPPFGSMKNNPLGWAKYWAIHFGYTDTNGKLRPFASPLKKRDGVVIARDPALERIENLQKALQSATSQEERAEIESQLRRFNLSKKWYLNVVDLEGKIGLLSIPHKMMLALEAELKRLKQEGHDPLSLDKGLFLELSKEGVGRDTVHKVQLYMETVSVNGKKYKSEKTHTIDDDFAARAERECFDLGRLYPAPSTEEVAQIVNGGPENLEAVLEKLSSQDRTSSGGELEQARSVLSGPSRKQGGLDAQDSGVIDYDTVLEELF